MCRRKLSLWSTHNTSVKEGWDVEDLIQMKSWVNPSVVLTITEKKERKRKSIQTLLYYEQTFISDLFSAAICWTTNKDNSTVKWLRKVSSEKMSSIICLHTPFDLIFSLLCTKIHTFVQIIFGLLRIYMWSVM